jgi:methylmalonyl-CoA/ethylmalonyl-CoA epimerase
MPSFDVLREGSAAALVAGVDHVAIAVHDADAATLYYRDELGMPVVHDESLVSRGTRLVYLDTGNTLIQLVQPLVDGPIADFLRTSGEGLHHIALAVPDISVVVAAVLGGDHHVEVFLGGRRRRACFLPTDSSRGLIELVELTPQP